MPERQWMVINYLSQPKSRTLVIPQPVYTHLITHSHSKGHPGRTLNPCFLHTQYILISSTWYARYARGLPYRSTTTCSLFIRSSVTRSYLLTILKQPIQGSSSMCTTLRPSCRTSYLPSFPLVCVCASSRLTTDW